jgi:hypothetical protein
LKIKYGPLVTLSFLFFITTIIVRPATADDLIEVLSSPDMASVGGNRINIICRIKKGSAISDEPIA